MADYEALREAVISGIAPQVAELTQRAIDGGATPEEILDQGLIPAMEVVGEKFQCGDFYFPEMLVAARAMYAGLNLVRPLLTGSNSSGKGKVVLGTVRGDLHDIGKNIVGAIFEGGGFQVIDLGVNVTPEQFVEAINIHSPSLLLMSALVTGTMPAMEETIREVAKAGLRNTVKIGVGGAPITQQYADEIGADLYAPDASRAVIKAKSLLGIARS